jgi:2,4-dienoyl-CoA reductase-like NADH-dependent reductase (Old Yellow Enzyme family)
MAQQFKYLFSPIKIGPVSVRNRIVSTPHLTFFFSDDGLATEKMAYYHAEKSKGGVGLTVIDATTAVPEPHVAFKVVQGYDQRCIPGLKRIADMVHQHGAKVFCEVWNYGGMLGGKGPSAVPDQWTYVTPKELEVEEIREWIEYYGRTARNVRDAGIDGIELHATHGAAIHQFNSPLWNRRTDQYGGSLEKRLTFLLEIISRIREEVGNDIALGVRYDGDEMMPGGITVDDSKKMAQILEATGKIDYLSIDTAVEPHQGHFMTAPMYVPSGHMVYAAAAVREAVEKIPVVAVGRIIDPVQAEKILADGQADLVGMTRAIIADPEMPNKALEGRLEAIRACLGDNENCIGRAMIRYPMKCTVNPAIGEEKDWGLGTLKAAAKNKKVFVVGGGPAGMEAARVAALRRYEVILYEKEHELGGQVNLAAKLPGRDQIMGIVTWLRGQMKDLGVEVHLGEEVSAREIGKLKPDAVVIATGAAFNRDGFSGTTFAPVPGWDQKNVTTPEEILKGEKVAGQKVIIFDETGFVVGPGLAELFVGQGKKVEILTSLPFVGMSLLPGYQLPWVYVRIISKVTLSPHTILKEISASKVTVINAYTGAEREIVDIDTVVLITGKRQKSVLYNELKGKVSEIYLAGDCASAHGSLYGIGDAIRDGHRVGRLL